jgi:hypothetical protein
MEKLLSIITPIGTALSLLISEWLLLILPAILYFVFKKFKFSLPKEIALKLFDFTLSLLILLFVFGFINSGLHIVADDAEVVIPLIFSELLTTVIVLLTTVYYIACLLIFIGFAFRSKMFSPPLSMKIFETLRG